MSTPARRDVLRLLMPGFVGTDLPDWVVSLLREGLGGICVFAHNVASPDQLASLVAAVHRANPDAIVSVDEEGGDVSRLHQHTGSPFPGNAVLGRLDDLVVTRAVAREVADQLARVGIGLTLAPAADVNSNPHNPVIGVRSFGAEPTRVARHTAAWIGGAQSGGVAACAKHFPGHGDTATDSHVAVPTVGADADELVERELVPFRSAIAAGTRTVMTSHIRVPALDPDHVATFSSTILEGTLRGQLGFEGVIVTDALDMAGASGEHGIERAAVRAVAAGADLLCLGSDNSRLEIESIVAALTQAVESGEIARGRVDDAVLRCGDLTAWIAEQRAEPAEGRLSAGPVVSRRRIAGSFAVTARARELIGEARPVEWVHIESEANVAIGRTPFGPFYDGGAEPAFVVPKDDRASADRFAATPGHLTVVVGREFHRDHGAAEAAHDIARRSTGLIVDMGFTHEADVDVATFGASRLVGEALLELVAGH